MASPQSVGVSLDLSPLFQFRKEFEPAIERANKKTADQARGIAQERAHVQSGAMQAGVYVATHGQSGYSEAVAAAQARDPKVEILPQIPDPPLGAWALSNATAQSVYEEFGTSKHGPHPFMMPAAIEAEELYVSNLETEIRGILPP